jgi:hypothetical protein
MVVESKAKTSLSISTPGIAGIHRSDKSDQVGPIIREDAPVPVLVRAGQRRLFDALFNAEMVQASLMGAQAKADVPQAVTAGQLPEKQLGELVPAVRPSYTVVAVVTFDTFSKLVAVDERKDLCKNIFSGIHTYGFRQKYFQIKSINQRTSCMYRIYYSFEQLNLF